MSKSCGYADDEELGPIAHKHLLINLLNVLPLFHPGLACRIRGQALFLSITHINTLIGSYWIREKWHSLEAQERLDGGNELHYNVRRV
jgi:hypothetical protein